MAANAKIAPPSVVWAQRNELLYLTINLEDVESPNIELTEKKLTFKGRGGPLKEYHEVEIEFYKEVNPSTSKYIVQPRRIPMVIMKKESGPYWPRLLTSTVKMHWLKTDFEKWREEDDEPEEDPSKWNMEDALANFDHSAYGAEPPGEGDDFDNDDQKEDSDDEGMPDLE